MRKILAVAACVAMLVVLGCQQGQKMSAAPAHKAACACNACAGCGKAASKPAKATSKPSSKPAHKSGCGCGCGM